MTYSVSEICWNIEQLVEKQYFEIARKKDASLLKFWGLSGAKHVNLVDLVDLVKSFLTII